MTAFNSKRKYEKSSWFTSSKTCRTCNLVLRAFFNLSLGGAPHPRPGKSALGTTLGPYARGTAMPTRTSPKNIISSYCNNCVIASSRSKWKVCIRNNTQTAVTNIRYKRILFEIIFYLTFRMLLYTS